MAAHDRSMYRTRVIMAATALLATGWLLNTMFNFFGQASSAVGQQLFAVQAWMALVFACGAFATTVDSISHEKRDGTLGLLFLTHLKGRDVILGKLVSAMTIFVAGAVATVPILALPVLLGGIQLSQVIYLIVSLLNMMLFSAASGLFASSVSLQKQKAAGLATTILLVFCILIPLAALGFRKLGYVGTAYILEFFTPLFAHRLASGAVTGLEVGYFWTSFAVILTISCGMLAGASWITPRVWQQRSKEPLSARLAQRYAGWMLRTIKARSQLGRELLDRNAYEWLAARRLSANKKAWIFLGCIVSLAIALVLNFTRHFDPAAVLITVCIPAGYVLQISIKVRVGGHASEQFVMDRECGALELILCTPMNVRDLIAGELAALRRLYLRPAIAVTMLLLLGLVLSLRGLDQLSQLFYQIPNATFRWRGLVVVLCGLLFLVFDCIALAWAGIWVALMSRKLQHARGNTIALVLAGPLILFGMLMPLLEQSEVVRRVFHNAGFAQIVFLITAFVVLCDCAIIFHARRWLLRNARTRLTEPLVHSRARKTLRARSRINASHETRIKIQADEISRSKVRVGQD